MSEALFDIRAGIIAVTPDRHTFSAFLLAVAVLTFTSPRAPFEARRGPERESQDVWLREFHLLEKALIELGSPRGGPRFVLCSQT